MDLRYQICLLTTAYMYMYHFLNLVSERPTWLESSRHHTARNAHDARTPDSLAICAGLDIANSCVHSISTACHFPLFGYDMQGKKHDEEGGVHSQTIPTMVSSDRDRTGVHADALLAWIAGAGGAVGNVGISVTAEAGLGLVAQEKIARGGLIFSAPCCTVLTAEVALADPIIGKHLREIREQLDDERLITLFLLHCKRLGSESKFSAYVNELPTEEQAHSLLPSFWPEDEQHQLFGATLFLQQLRATSKTLRAFHSEVIIAQLSERHPGAFPAPAYSLGKLHWAHAMWASRAINLPLPGGARQCLVPLLDLMNHSPGLPSTVNMERRQQLDASRGAHGKAPISGSPSGRAGSTGDGAPCVDGDVSAIYVVRSARPVASGGELYLNYGTKGNGELLRCHGFVIDDNLCDVSEIDLDALHLGSPLPALQPPQLPDGVVSCGRPGLSADQACHGDRQGATAGSKGRKHRFFLHRGMATGGEGSCLPDDLLFEARIRCASNEDERALALAATSSHDDTRVWDWSLVDWSAEDPFTAARAAMEAPAPAGAACEARTLAALIGFIETQLRNLPDTPSGPRSSCSSSNSLDSGNELARCRAEHAQRAGVYLKGQRIILEEAREELRQRAATLAGSGDEEREEKKSEAAVGNAESGTAFATSSTTKAKARAATKRGREE